MSPLIRQAVRSVFRGSTDTRIRATWRIALPIVVLTALATPMAFVPPAIIGAESTPFVHAISGVTIAVLTGGTVIATRRFDRRPATEYGVRLSRPGWLDFLGGIAVGLGTTGLLFLLNYRFGLVEVTAVATTGDVSLLVAVPLMLIGWLCWAAMEEVLFRGIVIPNAIEGLTARGFDPGGALVGSILISTALFAAPHVLFGELPADVLPSVALLSWTVGGILYGLAFALTGDLALPLGIHVTGNVATNMLFFGGVTDDGRGIPSVVQVAATDTGPWFPIHGLFDVATTVFGIGLVVGWVYWSRGGVSIAETASRWAIEPDRNTS